MQYKDLWGFSLSSKSGNTVYSKYFPIVDHHTLQENGVLDHS